MVNNLELIILIPLAAAIVNIILPVSLRKTITAVSIVLSSFFIWLVYKSGITPVNYFGSEIFSADEMSLFTLTFIQPLSFIILLFSLKGVEKESEKRFFILYPATASFCNAVVLSVNSISFLIFWGLSGLTLYLFALLGKNSDSPKTSKKTFIIVGGSDAFLILGIVLMWFLDPYAGWSLNRMQIPLDGEVSHIAFVCLLIAAFAKAGGFPFHTWVPEFSKDAPVESAAFLPASLDKILGIYLLARMVISIFVLSTVIYLILITLGALTVITAVMMAMNQHNGRKLLGYHAVSQVGYMIMGVGSGSVLAFAGGLFHLINHTIYKSNLFLTLGTVEKQTGTNELDNLGGLGKKMPATFIMALIGALSISGIPPFNGFFSKWMIYQGLLEKAKDLSQLFQIWLLVCLILAIFGSALTLASFMKFIHAVYLGKRQEKYNNIKEGPFNQWFSTGLLSILCIVFGLFAVQIPLNKFIYPVLQQNGMGLPSFLGTYDPLFIIILMISAFLLGLIIFLIISKVRYDEVYLGGMSPHEKFRIAGTEFYNEIRNMKPLKSIYNFAEKKYFDVYELCTKITFWFSGLFQKAHPGLLQLYLIYIVVGMLLLIWLVK